MRIRVVMIATVIMLAAFVAFSGSLRGIPLDSHEVFVAETAETMLDTGEWLVPSFNGEPRLRKPPLAYWLVALVDRVVGPDGEVTEFEARLPEILAAFMLVGATIALGGALFGLQAGCAAGLIVVASSGYATYSHSARSEMLNAAWSAAAVAAFAWSLRLREGTDRHRLACALAWGGWVAIGLATLSKGPQLSLLLTAGLAAGMFATGRSRLILPTIRPITGLPIAAAVCLWWFAAVWSTEPSAGSIWFGETVTRATSWESKWHYLDPYYLYRTAGLVVPWVVPYAIALASPWLRLTRNDRQIRLAWWMMIAPLAALHVSLGRRWYYMLPVEPVLAVTMVASIGTIVRDASRLPNSRHVAVLVAVHSLALAAALGYLQFLHTTMERPDAAWTIPAIAATLVVACLTLRRHLCALRWGAIATVACGALMVGIAADHGSIWSPERFARAEFARLVSRTVPQHEPLIGWKSRWEIEVYYTDRTIPMFDNLAELTARLAPYTAPDMLPASGPDANGRIWLLVDGQDLPTLTLPDGLSVHVARTHIPAESGEHRVEVWRITAPGVPGS